MKNTETKQRKNYPWKSFAIFLGIYLISVALHFPAVLEQSRVYLEIFGEHSQYTPVQFSFVSLIQPLLLGSVVIYFGHRFAKPVNLRSIVAERVENPEHANKMTLKDAVPFIVSAAVLVAILELGFDFVFQNWLPDLFQPQFDIPTVAQALSSVFYAGLAQEMLLRWGVMTAIIYVLSFQGTKLDDMHYYVGIVFTAVLYAFSQYNTVLNYVDLSMVIILRILLLSGLAGILFGWLYKTFHFEAAVLSHMLANVIVILGHILIVTLRTI